MIHDYGQHFIFPGCNDDTTVKNIMAQVADLSDQAIYNAITKAAQEAGVTDLYLMDKKFVLDAIREKLERENPKPLTIKELDKMIGEPVYIFSHPLELWEWNVLAYKGAAYFGFKNGRKLSFGRYGEQWIAYRHKPKEETT